MAANVHAYLPHSSAAIVIIHNEKGEKYDFQFPDIEQEAHVAL